MVPVKDQLSSLTKSGLETSTIPIPAFPADPITSWPA
jgi:hypothetical protein